MTLLTKRHNNTIHKWSSVECGPVEEWEGESRLTNVYVCWKTAHPDLEHTIVNDADGLIVDVVANPLACVVTRPYRKISQVVGDQENTIFLRALIDDCREACLTGLHTFQLNYQRINADETVFFRLLMPVDDDKGPRVFGIDRIVQTMARQPLEEVG